MPLRVLCPGCQSAFICPDDFRGKRLKCKKCERVFQVGSVAPPKSAAEPAVQTAPTRRAVAPPAAVAAPRPASVTGRPAPVLALVVGGVLALLVAGAAATAGIYFLVFRNGPQPQASLQPGTASPSQDTQTVVGKPDKSGPDQPDKGQAGPDQPDKPPQAGPDQAGVSGRAFFPLPTPGGFVMTPDGVTLIVSQPKAAKLVYYDTVDDKELKQVEVDFKPTALALQGATLFAVSEGSAVVYALDAATGKGQREFNVGGDAVAQIACHPTQGLVYATTVSRKVYSIDPANGTVTKTAAVGDWIAVDPVGGKSVYTGVKPAQEDLDTLVIKSDGKGNYKIIWDQWGLRGAIVKYAVDGPNLKFVAAQTNAEVNPYMMCLSPDGKRIMMTGGGGWRPLPEAGPGGGYITAVFSTDNLDSMLGQAPGGTSITFHPVLNLGATNGDGKAIGLFNAKSLIERNVMQLSRGGSGNPVLLTFGGKGCKAILWNGEGPETHERGLNFIPLDLKEEERAELRKVYGSLPPPPQPPAGDGWTAVAGFNDAVGLCADRTADSPYPLDKTNVMGGGGEPGWASPWFPSPNATFQKDVVFEGDGALHLTGTVNYGRRLLAPQTGVVRVEQYIRLPKGGDIAGYVLKGGEITSNTGPQWTAGNGKFRVMNGDNHGDGGWLDAGPCQPDVWYKVMVVADVPKHHWEFLVDDKKFDGPPLGFRGAVDALQEINYLVGGPAGAYLDAIRIGAGSPPVKAAP